jgi:Protein of unknown function (DUF2510)
MFEYASVSASAYDVTSLVSKVNEQAAGGWELVSIVPTGGDITAFLKRASTNGETPSGAAADGATAAGAAAVAEPAGWGAEPEPEPVETQPETVQASDTSFIEATSQQAPVTATAATATPAGWYPDPSGRYEMRYWDGDKWTEHVSRQGQTYTDPPVA